VEFLSHGGIPHWFRGIAGLGKDPGVRVSKSESGDPALISARQAGDCEFTFTFVGFGFVDVLMPVALLD